MKEILRQPGVSSVAALWALLDKFANHLQQQWNDESCLAVMADGVLIQIIPSIDNGSP